MSLVAIVLECMRFFKISVLRTNPYFACGFSGGWPLSVWLTPELKPFLAGTYFPPDDRYPGHPGFKSVLKSVIDTWTKRPDDVRRISDRMVATLQEHMDPSRNKERLRQSATEQSLTLHSTDTIDRVVTHFERLVVLSAFIFCMQSRRSFTNCL